MIDTHVHVYSDDFVSYPPLEPERFREQLDEVPATTPGVLGLMDRAGVTQACLVQALAAYADDNRYAVESARAHPDRFVSVVYVSPQDPDPVARLHTWIDQGAAGLRFSASGGLLQPERLEQSAVRALVAEASRCSLGVVFHLHFDELPQFRALMDDNPELRVALDHCGGLDAEALRDGPRSPAARPLHELAEFPGVYLKVTSMAFEEAREAGVDPRALVGSLAEVFGVGRLMWGSDWSHSRDRPYEGLAELGRFAFSELSSEEQTTCLERTPLEFWPQFSSS